MMGNLFYTGFVALGLLVSNLALSADPYWEPDDSWITLSGTVESVNPDRFQLKYGDGMVTVEMDDGDRDADAYKLLKGDKVTVTGKVDRDLFEKTKIEAGTVYVENIGTTFYSSAIDEEDNDFYYSYSVYTPIVIGTTYLYGTVSGVNGRHFTLDTGLDKITVDTNGMSFNPLDKKGYLQVKEGDRVSVSGVMTNDFFKGREFEATTLVSYSDNSKKNKKDKATSH